MMILDSGLLFWATLYLLSQFSSKVTVTCCSFYIKCSMCPHCCWTTQSYNVSLHKSSFFSCCFKTLTFHKVVWRHTRVVMASLVTILLQMYSWFWQWN